jgi:hypothetical protein
MFGAGLILQHDAILQWHRVEGEGLSDYITGREEGRHVAAALEIGVDPTVSTYRLMGRPTAGPAAARKSPAWSHFAATHRLRNPQRGYTGRRL